MSEKNNTEFVAFLQTMLEAPELSIFSIIQ